MANPNSPFGLIPAGVNITGGMIQAFPFDKPAALGSALAPGDVVARDASGDLTRSITPGTTRILGVNLSFGPTLTLTRHMVIIDSNQLYLAQMSGAFSAANAGNTANVTLGTAVVTGPVRSQDAIDSTTVAGNEVTDDVRIMWPHTDPSNEIGNYARVIVILNKATLEQDTAGL
jgi:hypothetical protein